MKLDERLQTIERVKMSQEQQQKIQQKLTQQSKLRQRQQLWTYRVVLAAVCGLLLFFISTLNATEPLKNAEQASLTGDIEQLTVVQNFKPESQLNLESPFYFQKRSTTNPAQIALFKTYLSSPTITAEVWNGNYSDSVPILDILLTYDNGDTRYLKFGHMEIIDVEQQKIYYLDFKENEQLWSLLWDIRSADVERPWKKYILIGGIVTVILYILFSRLKRPKVEESRRKIPLVINIVFTSIWVIPIVWMDNLVGTPHLGILVGSLVLSLIISEYYQVSRLGKEANWNKYLMLIIVVIAFYIALFI